VLATAGGHGTFEIMRRTRTSKPTVWRWQQRYLDEGVTGLKRDKTRPSRVQPLPMEARLKVIAKTVQEAPPNVTHWSRALMAEAMDATLGAGLSAATPLWREPDRELVAFGHHHERHRWPAQYLGRYRLAPDARRHQPGRQHAPLAPYLRRTGGSGCRPALGGLGLLAHDGIKR